MRKIITAFFIFFVYSCVAWGRVPKGINADGALIDQLSNVLNAVNNLHEALINSDEAQIATTLQLTIKSIKDATSRSSHAHEQAPHLIKMLNITKSNLELTMMQSGESRQKSLKKAFKQIVQLAKVYRVDNYRIFFCSKDESVWIQKSWSPKNPIHPKKYGKCGSLVGRT